MPGNTKSTVKDVDSKPSPQYFNPVADEYEYLNGRNGANRTEIYGPDGNPISVVDDKLAVRASEIETALAAILAKIIDAPATAKDFATQTTLAAILAKLIDAPATEAKQDTGITELQTLNAKDFSTAAKQDAAKAVLDSIFNLLSMDFYDFIYSIIYSEGIKKITVKVLKKLQILFQPVITQLVKCKTVWKFSVQPCWTDQLLAQLTSERFFSLLMVAGIPSRDGRAMALTGSKFRISLEVWEDEVWHGRRLKQTGAQTTLYVIPT